jgi:hypothetical protein
MTTNPGAARRKRNRSGGDIGVFFLFLVCTGYVGSKPVIASRACGVAIQSGASDAAALDCFVASKRSSQ